jgi:CxxC motif-containing protein (DUF1111 family)
MVFRPVTQKHKDLYGLQITPKALPNIKSEGWVRSVGSEVASYVFKGQPIKVAPRVAPQLAGLGLLEEIPESEILKNKKNGGVFNLYRGKVGRFGWKAEHPRLIDQVAAAFSFDMGITSYLYPSENCYELDESCLNQPTGADEEGVEIREDHLKMVTLLMASLKGPERLYRDHKTARGKEIFKNISCQSCHRISYDLPSGETIEPYTDLLLHDMGDGLSDPKGVANRKLWRTAPLWGLGSQKIVNGHTRYLHDGRAKSIEEAVEWHDGEAYESRQSFENLSEADKRDLLHFLKSL